MRCLDCRYVERPLYQYCEMDTDSAYIALAGDSIDNLVTSENREHYFRHRSEWLPAECCDKHEDDYVQTRLAGRSWTATESCCLARKAFDKHPACSKLSGVETGLLGCARKPTTVSVQLTSAQLKASANVTTSSTKTPFSPCSRIAAAVVALIVVFVCVIRR